MLIFIICNQVKLLDGCDVEVDPDGLRKATSAARKSTKPGFTLCYKLLSEIFPLEVLAKSRGQGIGRVKQGDIRLPLDKEKTKILKSMHQFSYFKNSQQIRITILWTLTVLSLKSISYCYMIIIYIIPVSSWLWIGAMFRLSEIMRKNFTYYKVKLNNEGDLNTHAIYSAKILPLLNPC